MTQITSKSILGVVGLAALTALSGCGDDGSGAGSSSGGASTGGVGGVATGGVGGTGTGGVGGIATGGAAGAGGAAGNAGAAGAGGGVELAALVRGTLYTTNIAEAQAKHDAIAGGGEAAAKAAGDIGHDVGLGTTLLGTTENAFMGLDRWQPGSDPAGFYGNPDFQKAFGTLFATPPTLELFGRQASWHTWGSIDAADGIEPHYYVVVRGHLAKDAAGTQPAHDQLAAGGEAQAKAAGDVAHVVFLGLQDEREFMAIDLWTTKDAMTAVYGDPDFQKAFGALFSAAPTLGVYESTSFHQW